MELPGGEGSQDTVAGTQGFPWVFALAAGEQAANLLVLDYVRLDVGSLDTTSATAADKERPYSAHGVAD